MKKTALLLPLLVLTACGGGNTGEAPIPGQPMGMSPTALWFGILFLAIILGLTIVGVARSIRRRR